MLMASFTIEDMVATTLEAVAGSAITGYNSVCIIRVVVGTLNLERKWLREMQVQERVKSWTEQVASVNNGKSVSGNNVDIDYNNSCVMASM